MCDVLFILRFKLLLLITTLYLVMRSAIGIKTVVPDEIIRILKSPDYNKHQLPSTSSLATQLQTASTMSEHMAFDGFRMTIDFRYSAYDYYIRILQVTDLNQVTVCLFGGTTYVIQDYASNVDEDHGKQYVNSSQSANSRSVLLDDRIQYSIELDRANSQQQIKIAQVKGASWNVIRVPSESLSQFCTAISDLISSVKELVVELPTTVTIGMYIEGLSSFHAQTMDFHCDIYFQETWFDHRLRHNADRPVLVRDLSVFEMMWHPDLYFANAKEASFHTVTSHNFLVWIYPDGTVYHDTSYGFRFNTYAYHRPPKQVSLVVNCMQDLTNYPLDTQECNIRILSYAYDNDNLSIDWKNGTPITINKGIMLPDMHLIKYRPDICVGDYGDLGKWSCVVAVFRMQREVMHHVLQSYVPTALIVVISWFSFWLDPDSVPGRVSLCITTLLTLATQSSAARLSLPQVSYAKAIDVWMGTCMAFVFGVMIEFTAVNFLGRRGQGKALRRRKVIRRLAVPAIDVNLVGHENSKPRSPTVDEEGNTVRNDHLTLEALCQMEYLKNRKAAIGIDKRCRLLFPLSFLIFNIIYWPFYVNRITAHEYVAGETPLGA